MVNSVDPDQMPHAAASDLGLTQFAKASLSQCLGFYGTLYEDSKDADNLCNFHSFVGIEFTF